MSGKLRRFLVMCLGILIMGVGVALFKISLMGNDPSTSMVMSIGESAGIDFSIILLIFNFLCFVFEAILGRNYIGIGTFVNWFFVGPLASAVIKLINSSFPIPNIIPARLIVMALGVLILSLSCALYQTADLGIAPYDAVSIMMKDRLPIPYFWCRIITDSTCAIISFAFAGTVNVGLGTLVCALGLGPFITFFTKHVAVSLVGENK